MKRYLSMITAGLMLASFASPQARAASNTWNNGSANSIWDTTSANWASPATWQQGNDAIFGATGAGTVTLGTDIFCRNMTFNANYTINANVKYFTNSSPSGQSFITSAFGTSNNLALAIYGTNSMTFQGTGTTVLLGDATANDANHYTGGTYVKAGTLILRAAGNSASVNSYAVGNIEAIDAGATVQIGTINDGVNNTRPGNSNGDGQILRGNNLGRLNLTGGTFDNNGDNNGINYPCPEGTGTIVNSSPYIRAVMKLQGGNTGKTYVFNGQIKDGGPNVTTSQGTAYQQNIDMNGSGPFTLVLGGVNTFTGFIRLNSGGNGNKIVLTGSGTLGYPPATNPPARHILMNSGTIDMNGTSQKVGYTYTGNNSDSIITNSAIGTVSTLTVCYNYTNLVPNNGVATPRGLRGGLLDDLATGGTLALTKEGSGLQPIGVYAADVGSALPNNYHGDTTVNDGILEVLSTSGISPNSAYRLNAPGVLQLDYATTANVKQLFVNGAQKANGVYGAAQLPGIITGTGTLTVTGSTGSEVAKTWSNGSLDGLWNTTSVNWTGLTWNQGESAVFGSNSAPTVNLSEDINSPNLTFYGTNYTINANTKFFTNESASGQSFITSASGTTNTLNLAIYGTNSMTFQSGGTTVLQGDPTVPDGNHYTGETYIKSGTVILKAAAGLNGSSSSAIGSISALDSGALLQVAQLDTNTPVNYPFSPFPYNRAGAKLRMTGGTLDLNGLSRNAGKTEIMCPEGFGLIVNSNFLQQSAMKIVGDGLNHTFAGLINDGGVPTGLSPAPFSDKSYQIGIVEVNGAGPFELTLMGANTMSGSWRLASGSVKLVGPGARLGIPSSIPNWTGPLRVYGPHHLDLNGHNQSLAKMVNGDVNGQIYNSAVGTVSVLTFGVGDEATTRDANMKYIDNPGTGGLLAMTKVGLGNPQTLSGANTYSGDTTVLAGTLGLKTLSAVSPNSAFRLSTGGVLDLAYSGTANVRQLWVNGVQQPNGTYGAADFPGIITSTTAATLTVTGFAPVTLNATLSGGNLNLSWAGVYKLQSCLNDVTGIYTDYVGGGLNAATIPVNPAAGAVYYRLVTY